MEPYLNAQHDRLRAEVREFGREVIEPIARELDRSAEFPWESVREMADRGYFGIAVPTALGGLGLDFLSYVVVVEELARWDASHAITVSAHTGLGVAPILEFGTEHQRQKYVPLLATGRVLGGFGLTEPSAGSDASGTRTRATSVQGGYRLSGSKIFITHAGVGEIFNVTAVTDPAAGARGITSFIVTKPTVDLDRARRVGVGHAPELGYTQGVRAGRSEDKMGWRASDTRELHLDDAFVPTEDRLGEEGDGFINFMRTLDGGRIGIAALSLGLAQGALDVGLRFAQSVSSTRKPLRDSQEILFRLASLATDVEAARHLTYHAAWLKKVGQPFEKRAAMAKLYSSALAMNATRDIIQAMGPPGFTDEYPVERMARDAKVCEIGEGTNEIQCLVIGRHLLREMMATDEVGTRHAADALIGVADAETVPSN